MGSMRLLFTLLACFVFATLFPADNINTTNATISCEARMSFRTDYERIAYKPIQSHSAVMSTDHTSLMKCHEAYRSSLSNRGYCTPRSSDLSYITLVPSPLLPENFRDDFSSHWYRPERTVQYFRNQFHEKLHKLGLHNQHDKALPYERAEMRQWWLYYSCEFRDFLKDFCVYQDYMLEIAAELARDKQFAASVTQACDEAVDWIQDEARRIRYAQRVQEAQQQFRQDVHNAFTRQPEWFDNDTRIFYEDYENSESSRFVKRAQAEAEVKRGEFRFTQQSYTLSKEATALLREFDIRGPYHTCYGNQLQQVIHQECVDLIERTAQLQPESPIFEYQESLVYFIEAAHIDNKVGRTHNASIIADFCYTLLDYGKAVLEGARDGLFGVVQQAINDPLQTIASTTLSIAAGEYMLAYQLGKIAYGVLNLTVNAVINPEQAQKTWDGYITPISSLIDALKNKQISLRDGIRAGTALAVSMKAQSMLAKGCEKLYSVAKTHALTYIAKNPLANPDQYMEMGDNFAFKLANDHKIEWAKHCRKHISPKGVDWKT